MDPSATGRRLSPCAEFPNDNPALHHGAIWRCDTLSGGLTVRLPSPQPASALARMASEGLAKLARVVAGEPVVDASETPRVLASFPPPLPVSLSHSQSTTAVADEGVADAERVPREAVRVDEVVVGEATPPYEEEDEEDDEPEAIEIVDELCFDAAIDESDGAPSAPPPAAEDPFARLVHALEAVAIAHGAGEESITCLRALFGVTRSDGMAPGERATEALLAAGIVLESAQEGRGLVRSGAFTSQVVAWQGILRGESEDFTACGGAALDEWAASALARVLGSPSKAESLRRELRGRGVAAFGLLADAA
jgi:hypothetical protein